MERTNQWCLLLIANPLAVYACLGLNTVKSGGGPLFYNGLLFYIEPSNVLYMQHHTYSFIHLTYTSHVIYIILDISSATVKTPRRCLGTLKHS
jgi:hypothetical protein